jgi:hypothetical protein
MFTRTKIIHGTKRTYLVESFRDAGKVRQRFLAYVDGWPKAEINHFKKRLQELARQKARSANETLPSASRRAARAKIVVLEDRVERHYAAMTSKLAPIRDRADRRQLHLRGLQMFQPKRNPRIEMAGRLLALSAALRRFYKEQPIEEWDEMQVHVFRNGLREFAHCYSELEKRDTFLDD